MRLHKLSTLLAATTLLATSSAMAWESENGQYSSSASVALASDYVWRGYSQTEEEAAISGSFDYSHSSGLYAGTWASNVDFGDDASAEIDIYIGFGNDIGDTGLSYDVGVLRYLYDGEDYDWNEYYGSVSFMSFTAGVAYSGDVYGTDETGVYYSLGFDYDLPIDVALSAGIGYYNYDATKNHTDYHMGLSKDMIGFGFDVSYFGMDSNAEDTYGDLADGRIVFTISKSM